MATDRRQLGIQAEELAAQHVQQHGYEIVLRNFRCCAGELDIVAKRGQLLLIIVVRLRSSTGFGGAAASITARKRARIVRATRYLLTRRPALAALTIRFDTLLLSGPEGPVDWIEDAFY